MEQVLDTQEALGIDPDQLPQHIAIIMDGNGRWARQRDMPRIKGHEAGSLVVRDVVTRCARLGLKALTLYSFSVENWKRPKAEVDFLMHLYSHYLVAERQEILDNNIRFRQLGSREGLPAEVLNQLDITTELSAQNTGLTLCLALNYGGRNEIIGAVRRIALRVAAGEIGVEQITEQIMNNALDTAGLPDPDLLIRTAGQSRISNFLLWQISYSELYIEQCCWPDYTVECLDRAIKDFAGRERRFGGL